MQGNERNNDLNDAQFTDFAWSEMSSMLDQEMPVVATPTAAPKKRYGLLLLCLLIGFASGIGTMFLLQQDDVQDLEKPVPLKFNPKEVADSGPIAKVQPSTAETDQLVMTNARNQDIENKIQTNFSNKSITQTNKKTIALDDKNLYNNSSSVVVFNQTSDLNTDDSSENSKSHENIVLSEPESSKTILLDEVTIPSYSTNDREMVALNTLAEEAIPLLDLPSKAIKLEFLQQSVLPKMSYGLYVGTHTRGFKGSDGFSAGLYASYQLDPKFSIRSGFGYSLIKGFHLETPDFADPLTPAFFEPIEDVEEFSSVSSLRRNQDLPIQSLHYLDLPLALNYRMSNKVGILMGMKLSYLINAKTDGYFSNNLNEEESALLDEALYNSMRKMDVATVLGFGIYPSSQLGLELKYNHGFVDYTIDEKWHVRQLNSNKTFELSINYFLK